MLSLAFVALVVLGFIFWFVATWPSPAYSERIARGLFLAAALVWAWMSVSSHAA